MTAVAHTFQTDDLASSYPRLEQQIAWYDRHATRAQWLYRSFKVAQIALSASVPIFVALHIEGMAAVDGAVIVVMEAVQQMFQWQQNAVSYRSTCEALRHEKYTWLGRVGPYGEGDEADARKLLVERVESRVATEHSKWVGGSDTERRDGCPKCGEPAAKA